MIETVIFDMDGVIINSEPVYQMAEKELFKKYSIPYEREILERFMGKTIKSFWENVLEYYKISNLKIEEIAEEHEIGFLEKIDHIKLIDGVTIWMKKFKNEGKRIYIASSSKVNIIEKMIKRFSIEEYINGYIGGDMIEKSKPDPEIFLKAAELSKSKPSNCLVIEDSDNGIKGAKEAGMKCIGYLDKKISNQSHKEADFSVNVFTEETFKLINEKY